MGPGLTSQSLVLDVTHSDHEHNEHQDQYSNPEYGSDLTRLDRLVIAMNVDFKCAQFRPLRGSSCMERRIRRNNSLQFVASGKDFLTRGLLKNLGP